MRGNPVVVLFYDFFGGAGLLFAFVCFCGFVVLNLFCFVLLVGQGPGWSRTSAEARAPAVRDVQGRPFCFFFVLFFPPLVGRLPFCVRSSVCFFLFLQTTKTNKKTTQKKIEGPGRSRTSGSARAPAVRDVRGTETLFFLSLLFCFFFFVLLSFRVFGDLVCSSLLVAYGPGWSRTSGEARAPAVRDVQGFFFIFFCFCSETLGFAF